MVQGRLLWPPTTSIYVSKMLYSLFLLIVSLLPQHHFADIPPGNYSGITWLGGDKYAVVSDKSDEDGFFIWRIGLDSITGEIKSAANEGFHSALQPNRDGEGIAFNPHTQTIFISGENDNYIKEYDLSGKLTGHEIPPTSFYKNLPENLGLEALSYNDSTRTLWTCNESGNIVIQSYGTSLQPLHHFPYTLDAPLVNQAKAQFYAHGVGTICAFDDGSLLMLEREFYVPKKKLGAFVNCKLFHFIPDKNKKELLAEWRTSLSLFKRDLANYEGMCLGPTLKDGSRILILVADSQNRAHGVLKDWIKTIRIRTAHSQPSGL